MQVRGYILLGDGGMGYGAAVQGGAEKLVRPDSTTSPLSPFVFGRIFLADTAASFFDDDFRLY